MPTGGNLHQRSEQFRHHDPDAEAYRRCLSRQRWELASEATRIGLNVVAYLIVLAFTLSILSGCGFAIYQIYTDPALFMLRDLVNMLGVIGALTGSIIWAITRLGTQWS